MTRRTLFSRLAAGFAALPLVGKATAKPVVNVDFMRGSGMPPPLSTEAGGPAVTGQLAREHGAAMQILAEYNRHLSNEIECLLHGFRSAPGDEVTFPASGIKTTQPVVNS